MTIQLYSTDGRQIIFQEIASDKYRGVIISGGTISQSMLKPAIITLQQLSYPLFSIQHRLFEIFSKSKFSFSEGPGLRFEAVLTGEMNIPANGERKKLRAGQYHLTDIPLFTALFSKKMSCGIFAVHYSTELLKQWGIETLPCTPQRMPGIMENKINELLHNPYTDNLRDFYYENTVRELLFFHLTQGSANLPGKLEAKDITAIYKADSIISSDLQKHYSIEELSKLSGINQLKIKKGFQQVFRMGVFQRLVHYRMEHAKILLETTDKSIGDIARLTGYDTAAGFIHAFRREFEVTPREWRVQSKRTDNEDL